MHSYALQSYSPPTQPLTGKTSLASALTQPLQVAHTQPPRCSLVHSLLNDGIRSHDHSTIPLLLAASTAWTSLLHWVLPELLVCQGQCQILDYCRCKAEVGKQRETKARGWVPAGRAHPILSKLTVVSSLESAHSQQEQSGGAPTAQTAHAQRTQPGYIQSILYLPHPLYI